MEVFIISRTKWKICFSRRCLVSWWWSGVCAGDAGPCGAEGTWSWSPAGGGRGNTFSFHRADAHKLTEIFIIMSPVSEPPGLKMEAGNLEEESGFLSGGFLNRSWQTKRGGSPERDPPHHQNTNETDSRGTAWWQVCDTCWQRWPAPSWSGWSGREHDGELPYHDLKDTERVFIQSLNWRLQFDWQS